MAVNRAAVASFLISRGFRIDQGEDGIKAVKLIEINKYDIIFSDIEMPNMNGYELLTKIRTDPQNNSTPVIRGICELAIQQFIISYKSEKL